DDLATACMPVGSYQLTAPSSLPERMALAWRVYVQRASDQPWELAGEETAAAWGAGEARSYQLRSAVCAQHVRFEFLRSQDPKLLRLGHIAVAGVTPNSAPTRADFIQR